SRFSILGPVSRPSHLCLQTAQPELSLHTLILTSLMRSRGFGLLTSGAPLALQQAN
ncbi:hypothetical protein ILYODFUR_012712, partial [Ilyodon furcidens]